MYISGKFHSLLNHLMRRGILRTTHAGRFTRNINNAKLQFKLSIYFFVQYLVWSTYLFRHCKYTNYYCHCHYNTRFTENIKLRPFDVEFRVAQCGTAASLFTGGFHMAMIIRKYIAEIVLELHIWVSLVLV